MEYNKPLKLGSNIEFIYQKKDDDKQEEFIQSFIHETNQPINDQSDNCYRLFWIDAVEKFGIVYIIGKIFSNESNSYISCCVIVKNIHRNVFILPRRRKLDENDNETEIDVTMEDVSSEVNDFFKKKFKDFQHFTKPVNRKYGFELPDIPAEAQYLKVTYPFTQDALPKNLSGKTFSRAFGTNTSALELFTLKRKIKGPCWLEIKDADVVQTSKASISWCKLELVVDDPKKVNVMKGPDSAEPTKSPSLTTMSLSLRTILNHQKQVNEIAAFSVRFYQKVPLDEAVSPEKLRHSVQYSAIRQLNDKPWWPLGFEELVGEEKKKGLHLKLETNEFSLINYLLALIKQYDPDVFIGHNFIGFDLDVLLHRLKTLRVKDWSCLGRLRRTVWPSWSGAMNESSFLEKSIVNGRLICDTYLNAKELIKSKNYSLTELVSSQLGKLRKDIEYDKISTYYNRANDLLNLVCHCWNDAILTAELMFKLQILPLTKQLTNLAGNIWSKTLIGGRADRNEFLLLHEFHQHKYICPDKEYKKIQEQVNMDGEECESTEAKISRRRKPTYVGGLVLEPKKGFYDNYVVLLDFNSLYPSIIQEYNICFTTVDRVGMEKDVTPEIPDSSLPQGILPKLIAKLVERRRMVKNLMKDPKATPAELAEYDIRQKALKLTANSMYGCLGFTYSRFYAKPLAMLITFKGREILEDTVKLAENEKMEVIYGDTDSIMINTKVVDINQALEVGNILKKKVNERYKLLELEIDGFFEKLLLFKKKKYAAIVVEKKNGSLKRSCETKGLDLVRRDWCDLVNKVSRFVLDQILSSADREVIVNTIHAYLRQVGEDTRSGKYPINSFIINKNLAKSPEAYTDAKIQPHVQVALRMKKKGLSARTGDFIPYIICLTTDDDKSESDKSISERAFHPDEINESNLRIDHDWYLKVQIHASVSRLCEYIDGIDNASVAECLGFNPSKFKSSTNLAKTSHKIGSKMPDRERFKDVEIFMPICINCNATNVFERLNSLKESEGLIKCSGCSTIIPFPSILTQLTFKVRSYIKQYYNGWKVCDEQSCLYRTRQVTYSKNCINRGCNGKMKVEYDEQKLYLQLLYLSQLFDIKKESMESGMELLTSYII
ncbi:DNA polymerase family B-domain-containing protein [Glomus cerebriforme]|uniref:DNA polymerase n=1 Tax=Glomus cerebriforme TaxID=658196 RepID=A0A397SZQ3_9GLOM|nr:DNA polymerase family B-domain-containing protein [Glomus cerebriforme]